MPREHQVRLSQIWLVGAAGIVLLALAFAADAVHRGSVVDAVFAVVLGAAYAGSLAVGAHTVRNI